MTLSESIAQIRRPGVPRVKFWKVSPERFFELCCAQCTLAPYYAGRPAVSLKVCELVGAKGAFAKWKEYRALERFADARLDASIAEL